MVANWTGPARLFGGGGEDKQLLDVQLRRGVEISLMGVEVAL
jgi:hypothetical protein